MIVTTGPTHSKAAPLLFAVTVILTTTFSRWCAAGPISSFRYEDVASLDDMKAFIQHNDPVGTPREAVRATFVAQGGGTLRMHPSRPDVEKYLYDINLCRYYVWRWNISADYDDAGRLRQMYVNGEPALPDGPQLPPLPKPVPGGTGKLLKISKPRPEADKGEKNLAALVFEFAGGDQRLIGAGPTRPDPADLGRLHVYNVEPWRSIFDADAAGHIAPYAHSCDAADAAQARARAQAVSSPLPAKDPR